MVGETEGEVVGSEPVGETMDSIVDGRRAIKIVLTCAAALLIIFPGRRLKECRSR